MAGVDVGESGGRKRATNSDINMIPFIDLLMCTIAFLLITAVWVTNSRINADAQVPSDKPCNDGSCEQHTERTLHLTVGENEFAFTWRAGSTVVSEFKMPKNPVEVGDKGRTVATYPDLAKALAKEWDREKVHFDPSDRKRDQVVLHTDNRAPFRDIVAVLDAIQSVKREMKSPDGQVAKIAAFNTTFSSR
jgi:biopolymer transport protein ExbD